MKRSIGERLKKARKDAKIRQGAAAEKMEMSRPTLSAIEADKRLVWAEEITKFAEIYKVSAYELLYGFSDELPEIEISECFLQALFGQSCKTFLDIVACPNWTKLQCLVNLVE